MTRRIRMVTYLAVVTLAVVSSAGCGVVRAANGQAGNVAAISGLSDKLQKGLALTYAADYQNRDGTTVTVQQQPPSSAFVTNSGPLIITGDTIYACSRSGGRMTCEKDAVTNTADSTAALEASGVGAHGFMAGSVGVGLLLAASLAPHATVSKSSKKIASKTSDCLDVSDLAGTSDGTNEYKAFTMCVTDDGILSEFSGTTTNGKTVGTTLTDYSDKIDGSLFQPPDDAVIHASDS